MSVPLLALKMRAQWIFTRLPITEEQLNDADEEYAVDGGNPFDEHRCGLASGYEAEWQPALTNVERSQLNAGHTVDVAEITTYT